MSGVHIEAVGINKWKLSGQVVIHLYMHEEAKPMMSVKWVVEGPEMIAKYGTAGVALAHAYQLAKGDTQQQATRY
jgi:hypothetical protein